MKKMLPIFSYRCSNEQTNILFEGMRTVRGKQTYNPVELWCPFSSPLNSFESERRVTIRQRRFCPRNLRLVGRALLRPPVLGNPFCKTPITAAGVLNGRVAGGAFNWTATDPL
jgi:hypothetical protein